MQRKEKMVTRQDAFDFISAHKTATLATIDDEGSPHAAAVQYIAYKDLSIFFTTRIEARKFKNLTAQPIVAIAITDEVGMATIQLTGTAERVQDFKDEQRLLQEIWTLRFNVSNWPIPSVQMYEQGATNNIAVVRIVPFEMSYATFKSQRSGKFHTFFHKII